MHGTCGNDGTIVYGLIAQPCVKCSSPSPLPLGLRWLHLPSVACCPSCLVSSLLAPSRNTCILVYYNVPCFLDVRNINSTDSLKSVDTDCQRILLCQRPAPTYPTPVVPPCVVIVFAVMWLLWCCLSLPRTCCIYLGRGVQGTPWFFSYLCMSGRHVSFTCPLFIVHLCLCWLYLMSRKNRRRCSRAWEHQRICTSRGNVERYLCLQQSSTHTRAYHVFTFVEWKRRGI